MNGRFDKALHACERLLASLFPTITGPCEPSDYSSGVTRVDGAQPAIVLYDLVYDGVELTRAAFDQIAELVDNAIQRARSCGCGDDAGCIRCVQDPRQESPASKSAALECLAALAETLAEPVERRVDHGDTTAARLTGPADFVCPECNHRWPPETRFCSQCGTRLEQDSG